MRPTDIMEEISKSYLEVIANSQGYFNSISRDFGTDLTIRKAQYVEGRNRYLTTGKAIDIQVKSVLSNNITETDTTINYYLESKNYNDLIDRLKEKGAFIPLILIVFIMPNNEREWITLTPQELIVRKCAYWYRVVDQEVEYTENKTKVVIRIPKQNIVSIDFFNNQFNEL
jgi:hypothetical protein